MTEKTAKILFHAQCFDGFSSAALFTRFIRERLAPDSQIEYVELQHGTENTVVPKALDGDVNCIVDFRYVPDDRLHWWFDHHRTAFVSAEDQAHFDGRTGNQHFWDPNEPSCAGYIARVLADQFDFDIRPLEDLIRWANFIDSAQYANPQEPVELQKPALQLMSVLEHLTCPTVIQNTIEGLSDGTVESVALRPEIQTRFAEIKSKQDQALSIVQTRAEVKGDVVFLDMTNLQDAMYNKWSPYYLFPDCTYVVVITDSPKRVKVAVGSNPWRQNKRRHVISDICARYGGGGHAVVGGVNRPRAEAGQLFEIANEITQLLRSS